MFTRQARTKEDQPSSQPSSDGARKKKKTGPRSSHQSALVAWCKKRGTPFIMPLWTPLESRHAATEGAPPPEVRIGALGLRMHRKLEHGMASSAMPSEADPSPVYEATFGNISFGAPTAAAQYATVPMTVEPHRLERLAFAATLSTLGVNGTRRLNGQAMFFIGGVQQIMVTVNTESNAGGGSRILGRFIF